MTLAPLGAPLGLLAELTHRCPLHCPYCSNPLDLVRRSAELDTATWQRIFAEAAALGCLQLHLSGGEPLARPDILALAAAARGAGLYVNLITSGVLAGAPSPAELAAAGVDHVQLSLQDAEPRGADRIAGLAGAHARKLAFARGVAASGLPLTVNVVVHRQNLARLEAMIALATALGAVRLEVAHVQYHGWALANRDALLPTQDQVDEAARVVAAARPARMPIDHVVPDYFADRPKPCIGGWGQRALVVTPAGRILPCHAAESLPGFAWPEARTTSLRAAWRSGPFARYRGTAWMKPPCQGCPEAERDWGGCRCQAHALAGDAAAADPVCALSPHHHVMLAAVEAARASNDFTPRSFSRA